MGRTCELCPDNSAKPATVYCAADVCYLCASCDQEVHSANRLASRHVRRPVVQDDLIDGSSINEESDARVPDVSLDHNKPSLKSTRDLLPSSSSDGTTSDLPSLNDVSVTFEDAAEYDFCFEAIGARMPPLTATDDDGALFSDGKLSKNFYSDISWDSVVSDAFEHVVPDVSNPNLNSTDVSRPRHDATHDSNLKMDIDTPHTAHSASPDITNDNTSNLSNAPDTNVQHDLKTNNVGSSQRVSSASLISTKVAQLVESKAEELSKPEELTNEVSTTKKEQDNPSLSEKAESSQSEESKAAELRKKRRLEALARFRSKRANRSFTKKVRYECRKQLADSRPRVKGRFVRKVEMALFRKYGALYRDHLDELNDVRKESCVPTL